MNYWPLFYLFGSVSDSLRAHGEDSHDDPQEGNPENGEEPETGTHVLVQPRQQTKTPSFYKVVMLNDDFTPRDFVVHVLQKFFQRSEAEATQVMLNVHHQGSGVAGVYTFEIAETKAYQCNEYARKNQHPLKCTVEKA